MSNKSNSSDSVKKAWNPKIGDCDQFVEVVLRCQILIRSLGTVVFYVRETASPEKEVCISGLGSSHMD